MYVTIDLTDYSTIRNLSFSPQTDVTGNSLPINEFSVDIVTDDDISFGQYAELYDDLDNLWAKYWINYAERLDAKTVRIRAQSDLSLLDGVTLAPTMYSSDDISDVLDAVMVRQSGAPGIIALIDYTLDSSLSSLTISGFCPKQSARERLQWICFTIGAYVKTYFNDQIEILPIDDTETLVPINRTFWKPTVTYKDYVTAVRVVAYSFAAGTPSTTDEWVSDGTTTYIVTPQEYTITNSYAPSAAADNVVSIEGVYLVNSSNVSWILTYLSELSFKRTEVALDAINNAAYKPGDKLIVYADDSTLAGGYVASCAFSFGLQARAQMKLTAAENVDGAKLTLIYLYGDMEIGRDAYLFPIGYDYTVQMLFIEWLMSGHKFVYRPTIDEVTGTMEEDTEEEVEYAIALDLEEETGILEIVSVDGLSMADGVVTIT